MLKRVKRFLNEVSFEGQRIESNLREVKDQYRNKNNSYMQF